MSTCFYLLPPLKEVMFLLRSVCLSVCLWRVGHGSGTNEFNFVDDPDHRPDPGIRSPKSEFTRLSKKLSTDFDEFYGELGCGLVTFW